MASASTLTSTTFELRSAGGVVVPATVTYDAATRTATLTPLGALDPISRSELQAQLVRIFRELRKTVVLVTHDVREAFVLGSTITLLNAGRVVQRGTFADLARRPAAPFVTEFLSAQTPPPEMRMSL